MLNLDKVCGQGGTPLSALLLGRAAKWANVDPLGGAPLFTLGRWAAAVQACRVRLAIRQEAAGTDSDNFHSFHAPPVCTSAGPIL